MKKVITLTEVDLSRIIKKVLIVESQQTVNKIISLNKKYPGQRTAEWCSYAVLSESSENYNKPNCYIKNCLGSTDNFCKKATKCPSCYGSEFLSAHVQILSCMSSCFTTKKYNQLDCGIYEGQIYC